MEYLDLAVVKFTGLANKDDLLEELDQNEFLRIELLDVVLQKSGQIHEEDDQETIMTFFDEFTQYPITFLANNSLYYQYKSNICGKDDKFNRILLKLIQ